MSKEICHICEKEGDIECEHCSEFTCEDCLVGYTQYNQVDFNLCTSCGDSADEAQMYEAIAEEKYEEDRKKVKEERNARARANYRLPVNVEKRKAKRRAEHIARVERQRESARRVGEAMRNIFR